MIGGWLRWFNGEHTSRAVIVSFCICALRFVFVLSFPCRWLGLPHCMLDTGFLTWFFPLSQQVRHIFAWLHLIEYHREFQRRLQSQSRYSEDGGASPYWQGAIVAAIFGAYRVCKNRKYSLMNFFLSSGHESHFRGCENVECPYLFFNSYFLFNSFVGIWLPPCTFLSSLPFPVSPLCIL